MSAQDYDRNLSKPVTRSASIGPTYFWGMFMFAAFMLLAVFYFRFGPKPENYDEKRAAARSEKLQALMKDNAEKLSTYKVTDKQKGVAQIPVQRAMELVVEDLKVKKPTASAVKVEVPYPVGLGQTSPSVALASGIPDASPATAPAVPVPQSNSVAPSPTPPPPTNATAPQSNVPQSPTRPQTNTPPTAPATNPSPAP